ncbi:hypothetical protein COCON_G00098850 [Conger conger]|uniref:Globin domain-containing protein n=1 Tax=Conger conger TaxID=82655 RepID=A0A9Q1DMJ3_CONCO|nr:hemoglobin cathodic subunit alpha-like [Conger conger]KAJ8275260.1 hypothetical protein COCON_G00098850 [Conger conger]
MSLTAEDKALVKTIWGKLNGKADAIGAEALERMLIVYPTTKAYFAHWPDISPGSESVRSHGKTIMAAVADAVGKIDNLVDGLSDLSELHATKLRIDPSNFEILSLSLVMSLAREFQSDFTPEVHTAMSKFFEAVSTALTDKYK